jgi:hypothetical protein
MPEWSMAWQLVGKMQVYTSWHGDSSLISVSEKLPDWSCRWTCWCCFLRFAVLLGVMWIMFPEGTLTKIAECCQLCLNSDRLRLEHRLPAVDGDCYRSMSAVHQESKTQSVYCWMFWIMFDCIHCGSNLLISAACFGQDSVMLLFFVLISVIYSQLNHIKFDSNSMQAEHGSWLRGLSAS